jgi:hypothetical protein
VPRTALQPVRVLRDDEAVKVYYLDTGVEFRLKPEKPVEILRTVGANDDQTTLEVLDPAMVAVRQVDEFGAAQTLVLSPRMAVELVRLLNSYVFFPKGP